MIFIIIIIKIITVIYKKLTIVTIVHHRRGRYNVCHENEAILCNFICIYLGIDLD